jgi:hypothetical protein
MFRISIWIATAMVALGAAGTATAGRGVRPAEPAGSYMVSVVKQKLTSDYATAWKTLYAAHQRVASLDAYVACESLAPDAGTMRSVRALRTYNERIPVAGKGGMTATKAVDVRVTVDSPLVTFPVVIEQTFHAIKVSGRWRWILSFDQYRYYSAGECPYV